MQTISRIAYEACPLCGSTAFETVATSDATRHPMYRPPLPHLIKWLRCLACTHVFVDGYFSAEALAVLFSGTQDIQNAGHDMERQRHVSAKTVESVSRYVRSGGWLDVGFGNGSLMFTAEEFGFKALGLDLRAQNVEQMRAMGFDAYCADITSIQISDPLSVISMADVLEHMPFPRKGLEAAARLLRVGGVLFLSMPNSDSPIWKMLTNQSLNPYWMELEHYHNFGRARLYSLLEEYGFEPVEYRVSERYRAGMEVIAIRTGKQGA